MPTNLGEVQEWMEEGDRLLSRGWEHLAAADTDPSELDIAGHHFSRAAQTYLAGAVAYQRGSGTAMGAGAVIDEPAELMRRLEGRLGVEAVAAETAAVRQAHSTHNSQQSFVARARVFAEQLRDRFSHAAPEAFNRSVESDLERMDSRAARGR
jgi:hypothetical protein